MAALSQTPTYLKSNMSFTFDDVLFEAYPPLKEVYAEEDNDYSIVISVTHGANKFLYAGDAEKERIGELYSQIDDLAHAFLKVPHHGVYNKATTKFIQTVAPKYAVITCGKNDPPDDETIQALANIGCQVYLTPEGAVTAVSDGSTITVTQ